MFAELDETVSSTVKFGDDYVVEICGHGTVLFQCKTKEPKLLTNVYYIPRLRSNIVSLGQLDEIGCRITVGDGNLSIFDRDRVLLAKVQRSNGRLYLLNLRLTQAVCLLTKRTSDAWRWHARYGHLNFRSIRNLSHLKLVEGLQEIHQIKQVYEGCPVGKQHRRPFLQTSVYRAESFLELAHGDLCGPITPKTPEVTVFFVY